jgi:DNA-binding transcriptional ArsR family regulator
MASEHLRLMKHCGLLASERDGRKTYYRVAEPHLASIMECVEARFGAGNE